MCAVFVKLQLGWRRLSDNGFRLTGTNGAKSQILGREYRRLLGGNSRRGAAGSNGLLHWQGLVIFGVVELERPCPLEDSY